jgi:D-xylose transport system substrate-binding protein
MATVCRWPLAAGRWPLAAGQRDGGDTQIGNTFNQAFQQVFGTALHLHLVEEAEPADLPPSPNAALYRGGALSVVSGKVKTGRSYDIQGWSTDSAHANMSAAMAALGPDRIDGVLAANDAIAAGVISALKSAGVKGLPPVTGQDADLDAVQRIVRGERYMTVYKSFKAEADAAAAMAVALGSGGDPREVATTTGDSPTTRRIPSVLLTPSAVTVDDINPTLLRDGMYTADEICTPELRPACDEAGLTR